MPDNGDIIIKTVIPLSSYLVTAAAGTITGVVSMLVGVWLGMKIAGTR